jgi:uncharacterized membrane protein YgdD (TMEM256/DUF423 family)
MSRNWLTATRIHLAIAALFGLAGVAMLAGGTHSGAGSLGIAGQMLLSHAPVIMASTILRKLGFLHGFAAQLALALLIFGAALFAGDLALRSLQGVSLFRMAAPLGGGFILCGWLGLLIAAMVAPRQTQV